MLNITFENNAKIFNDNQKIPLFKIIYENGNKLYIQNEKNNKKYTPSLFLQEYFNLSENYQKNISYFNNNEDENLCSDCLNEKKNNKKETFINSICSIHNAKYEYYCLNCKINLCELCFKNHSHEHEIVKILTHLHKKYMFIKKIETIEKNIINIENILEDILKNLENEINNFKTIITQKLKEFKDIIEISKKMNLIYEKKKKKNDISYEIIQNTIRFTNFINLNFTFKQKYNYFEKAILFFKFITQNNILHETEEKIYNNKISKRKNILTLKNHKESVQCLLILKDGRLVSSSNDGLIIIYKTNFEIDLIINIHKKEVYNIIQNHLNDIISCSADKTINIIQLLKGTYYVKQTLKSHSNSILHIREFSNKNLFSSSSDLTIKIWNNTIKGYQLILTLKTKDKIYSILELKKFKQFVCLESEKNVIFYNLNDFNIIYSLKEIENSGWTNSICLLNDNIIGICGKNKIIIFNISTYEILHVLQSECQMICIKKFAVNFILTTNILGQIFQYELINDNLLFVDKINAHQNKIPSIVQFENGILVTCSNDNTIKIWK